MDSISFDSRLCQIWNNYHENSLAIRKEQLWDFCRLLETEGILKSNPNAVSTYSIGPFYIASKMEPNKSDLLICFVETVIPALISFNESLPFETAYPLYIVPAGKILITLLSKNVIVKDPLEWSILLYIKNLNSIDIFPQEKDVYQYEIFSTFEVEQIRNAIVKLIHRKNIFGDEFPLINKDVNGCMFSLV